MRLEIETICSACGRTGETMATYTDGDRIEQSVNITLKHDCRRKGRILITRATAWKEDRQ